MRSEPRHPVRHCAVPQAIVVSPLSLTTRECPQEESMGRFDFRNIADMTKTIDRL